jgi:hypothetical protein
VRVIEDPCRFGLDLHFPEVSCPLLILLPVIFLRKRSKDVVPVNDPDKGLSLKNGKTADIMFYQQFCCMGDRLIRRDRDHLMGHHILYRCVGMLGNH